MIFGGLSRSSLAALAVSVTIFAWAAAFPLIHIGLQTLKPLPLAADRFALAAIVASLWLAASRPKLPTWGDLGRFVLCGLAGMALYNALLNAGQQTVSPGAAAFSVGTCPMLTALLAALFLKERFGQWGWIGSLVALTGVAVIAAGQPGGLRFGAGASLMLCAALSLASYFTLQRPLVPRYGPLACTAYTIIAGALMLVPWLGSGIVGLVHPQAHWNAIGAVFALAILSSAIGFATWCYALDYYGASRASNFLYLTPPLSLLISLLLTGETVRLTTVGGGFLAIAGVAVVNLRSKLSGKVRLPKCITQLGLDRAASTWGGYQVAAPRDNRPCLADD